MPSKNGNFDYKPSHQKAEHVERPPQKCVQCYSSQQKIVLRLILASAQQ